MQIFMVVAKFGKTYQLSFIGKFAVHSTATDLYSIESRIVINSVSYNIH